MWLLFAFSGPLLWAASTHIDKYLVEKYFKHGRVAVLMVFTAIVGVLALPLIFYYQPNVLAIPFQSMVVIAVSGMLYMGSMYFYLQALQTEDASTVAPFFQAAGLFGLILGYVFLGETLSSPQIIGGLCVIGGSGLLSLRFGGEGGRFKTRLVLLMLASAFALALTSLIFKSFAEVDQYWTTVFWNFVGEALFGVALMLITANRTEFFAMLRTNTAAVLSVNAANELINLGGGLGTRYALLLAPLGIVQAISSTTLFFVLLIGVLLSVFFPHLEKEDIGTTSLLQKGIATALIVIGVLVLHG